MIFLFEAFVNHLLAELYEQASEPVLALEEPETHLHPQAVRTLWSHIDALPGQKIVTTHSPYFVQHVPFRDLRLVRLSTEGTTVRSLPANFSELIPPLDGLKSLVENSEGLLTYKDASGTLTVHGSLRKIHYRGLLKCCQNEENRSEIEARLRKLLDRSSRYVTDEELQSLETYAQRMRGEIFFADRWLIVEVQADYLLVHATAHALDYDLDQHGVSVIDAKNNGSPGTFAALARALDIPWLAVFDGDHEGKRYVESLKARGFGEEELAKRCRRHSKGNIEEQLVADGMKSELCEVLEELGVQGADCLDNNELIGQLKNYKTAYAVRLATKIRSEPCLADCMPESFRDAIVQLKGLK